MKSMDEVPAKTQRRVGSRFLDENFVVFGFFPVKGSDLNVSLEHGVIFPEEKKKIGTKSAQFLQIMYLVEQR